MSINSKSMGVIEFLRAAQRIQEFGMSTKYNS